MRSFPVQAFDAVFSLGYNCRCAMYLRDAHLRDCSSPFDWVTGAGFEQRIDMLTSTFEGWLVKENLKLVEQTLPPGALKEHERYDDQKTGFVYLHDFDVGASFDVAYESVVAKYDRRIRRLQQRLDTGGRYLFVWWSVEPLSTDRLLSGLDRVQRRFGMSEISLLAVDNQETTKVVSSVVEGTDGRLVRISGPLVRGELDMSGDETRILKLLGRIRVKGRLRRRVRWVVGRFLIHALTWYFPTKAMRRKYKKALKPIFLGSHV